MIIRRFHFSVIELMMVLVIVGLLVWMLVPSFTNIEYETKQAITHQRMVEIQKAITQFSTDVNLFHGDESLMQARLDDMRMYGLWPLMQQKHPIISGKEKTLYPKVYDETYKIGRRTSAYIVAEDSRMYGNSYIPVILDCNQIPFELKARGSSISELKQMVLVSAGGDKLIAPAWDTLNQAFDANYNVIKNNIQDDLFIELFPQYKGAIQP